MEISRDTYTDPELGEVRLYEYDGHKLPSVTTILKSRDEDLSNLYDWQDRHDGEGDNADHNHWFWYSRHRGTLAHFRALKKLDPALEWSSDEAQSIWALGNVDQITAETDPDNEHEEVHNATPREVLYTAVKYQGEVQSWGEFYDVYPPYRNHDFYSDALIDRKDRDVRFFVQTFERMCETLGITSENAIEVERFLFDTEYGYAGQCDLILEYPDGSIAMADLKTKKGAYDKEKWQTGGYASAAIRDEDIPIDHVDRTEVWAINPDTGKHAIFSEDSSPSPLHTSKYWNEPWEEHADSFEQLALDYEYNVDA